MAHTGPLNGLPIACTLTPAAGKVQVEKWQRFDDEYALGTERTDTRLTVHYVKLDDSIRRLRELVAAESTCCAFVDWNIDESHADLQLIITGTADQLATLSVGSSGR